MRRGLPGIEGVVILCLLAVLLTSGNFVSSTGSSGRDSGMSRPVGVSPTRQSETDHVTVPAASERGSTGRLPEGPASLDLPGHSRPLTSVRKTLVIGNNTLLPGNYPAADGVAPDSTAYDSGQDELFIATQSDFVLVASVTTGRVLTEIPVSGPATAVAYDNESGEVFVAIGSVLPLGVPTHTGNVSVVNDTSDTIVAQIPLGYRPSGLAVDTALNEVFVTGSGSYVSVISAATDSIVSSVIASEGLDPFTNAPVYDPARAEVWVIASTNLIGGFVLEAIDDATNLIVVSNYNIYGLGYDGEIAYDRAAGELFVPGEFGLQVVDDSNGHLITTLRAGGEPLAAVYDPSTAEVFVADGNSNTTTVIATGNNTAVANVSTGGSTPFWATYVPGHSEVFFPNYGSDSVVAISDTTFLAVAAVQTGPGPSGVALASAMGDLIVTDGYLNQVYVVSDSTDLIVATIPVGISPNEAVFDSRTDQAFVTNTYSNNLSVISLADDSVVRSLPAGIAPFGVAMNPALGEIYVVAEGNSIGPGSVLVFSDSTDSLLATIPVEGGSDAIAFDSGTNELFVTSPYSESVQVISAVTLDVLGSVSVGGQPSSLTYDPAQGELFVANFVGDSVSVICDGSLPCGPRDAVIATISVGDFPDAIAYDSLGGSIIVANSASGSADVISTHNDTVVESITVGESPEGVACDGNSGVIYVSNTYQGTLSILSAPPTYLVSFEEFNLPPSKSWAVWFDGTEQISSSPTIAMAVPNGTYPYLIQSEGGYRVSRAYPFGSLTVAGGAVGETIPFVRGATYTLTFHEHGLGRGTRWCVSLISFSCSTTGRVSFPHLTPATYAFSIGTVGALSTHFISKGLSFGSIGSAGLLLHAVTIQVRFEYFVAFTETGLPSGTSWTIHIDGLTWNAVYSTIVVDLMNGSYAFRIPPVTGYTAAPTHGYAVVFGSNLNLSVRFT